jgi:hypothetical protein
MTIEYKSVMLWLVKTSHFISRKNVRGLLETLFSAINWSR